MKFLSPFERAAEIYDRESCPRTLCQDLELHLIRGYVLSTPEVFVMARPVNRDAPYHLLTNPHHSFNSSEANCWWIYLASGDWKSLFKHMPYRLPYIGWEINNVPRFYRIEKVEKHTNDNNSDILVQGRGKPPSNSRTSSPNTGRR